MQTTIERIPAAVPARTEARRLGALSLFAAVYTWALVVFGGIVRITGSGLGCGDDWPRCNGHWIPPFTFETLIEYTHRMLAAGIGLVVLAVFGYAFMNRKKPGIAGSGGLMRPVAIAAALLVVQIVLGAITVRLELPPEVTVLHFVTAMLFMAALIVAAIRGGIFGAAPADGAGVDGRVAGKAARMAAGAAVVGLIVVAFGAVTANVPGAPQACQGFPLCNGALLPVSGSPPVHIHWTHRLLAILLFLHVLAAMISAHRRGATRPVRRAVTVVLVLIATQIAVAAALVLSSLPRQLQALHLAVGAAIWFALVTWATLARRDARALRARG